MRKPERLWTLAKDGERIKELLLAGGVIAVPTESSFGLAADPRSAAGVEAVYSIKRREARKPLPLVVANAQQAEALGLDIKSPAFEFGEQFWPAALTMLVPYADRSILALGDLEHVAVRIPDYQPLLDLLGAVGFGLTATSANLSGASPLVSVADVLALLSDQPNTAVVASNRLSGGAPSTVVAWLDGSPRVLRQGRFEV